MNWQFWGDHWFLAFCAMGFIYGIVMLALKVLIRLLRSINVLCRGWPPEHLDADGDWKPAPTTED